MLDRIKQLLGGREIPEEVGALYRGARDEREALILLKEARRRDEARCRRAIQDLDVLGKMEEQLLEEGRQETAQKRRLLLARRIKEIRWKQEEINHRIDNIYHKRIKVLVEHLQSLETVLELKAEELPDREAMERIAIRAREMIEELDKAKELAEGIRQTAEPLVSDREEAEILKEFEQAQEKEIEAHELKDELAQLERSRQEPPGKERPREEPRQRELE